MFLVVLSAAFTKVEGVQSKDDTGGVPLTLKIETAAPDGPRVVVDVQQTYQTITGFGSAYTESSAYNYHLMSDELKAELIDLLFSRENLNLNWGRIPIGSADFSLSDYSCVQENDNTLDTFSLDRDREYVIPFLKAIIHAQPGITLFGSPWSPPAFMKDNKKLENGGKLLKENWGLYAKYMTRWVQAMRDEGIPIWGVTIQNEPLAVQSWESCEWSGQDEANFAVQNLRPTLDSAGLKDVTISVWDHNRDVARKRGDESFGVTGAKDAIWGFALHWYGGANWDQVDYVHDTYNPHIFTTEFCINSAGGAPSTWADGRRYVHEFLDGLNHWVESVTDWNVLLDETGGPYHNRDHGDKAPMRYDTTTKQLTKAHMYWSFYHFSHYIQQGAKRIGWTSPAANLYVTAAQNPDGSVVVVLLNEGSNSSPVVEVSGEYVLVDCPANAVTTILLQ